MGSESLQFAITLIDAINQKIYRNKYETSDTVFEGL